MNATRANPKRIWSWLATLLLISSMIALPGGGFRPTNTLTSTTASYIVQAGTADLASQAVQKCGGQVTSSLELIESAAAQLNTAQLTCVLGAQGVIGATSNGSVMVTGHNGDDDPKGKGEGEDQRNDNERRDDNNGQRNENDRRDDRPSAAPATDYADVTGADLVWTKGKDTGKRVTVAVVDTGVAELKGIGPGRIRAWVDFVDGSKKPFDPNGHGTHVAGVIANNQEGSDREANGIAPDVDLVVARVLKEDGSGTYENVIKGIQWVVQNKARYNIRVLNLSLVAPVQSPYFADPLNRAVTAAWASGITVVAAAGNGGPGPKTISVPGNNPYVITVGAYTDAFTPMKFIDDYITPFSAAGPTLDGFTKPDVIAPGAHIVSKMEADSYVAQNNGATPVSKEYYSMAGTSQASAIVSGIAALVIAQHPELSPNQVKYRLMTTALPWMSRDPNKALYSIWQQGAGRVNAPDAVFARISGEANLGMDIRADLAGTKHYEGYTTYNEATHTYGLKAPYGGLGSSYVTWNGEYTPAAGAIGAWSGAIGAWSGAIGAWSGAIGAWSGAIGAWSGAIGAWSGAIGAWSGAIGAWSGAIGAWSGAIGAWSGAIGAWSGAIGAWSGSFTVDTATIISTSQWVGQEEK